MGWQKKLQVSQEFPLKGRIIDLGLRQTHSLWAPALGQQLEGHLWHTGRNCSAWKQGRDLQFRLLYPAKLLFRIAGQIECFLDRITLKEFIITKSLLYEMLKELR